MSTYRGTVIEVYANKQAPDAFWESIIKEFPTVAGFAAVKDGTITQFVQDEWDTDKPAEIVQQIKDLVARFSDTASHLFLGNFSEGFSLNSIQPFPTVTDKDDELVMVTFSDGNFDERIPEGTNESGEFVVHAEFIQDAMRRIYKGAGKDVTEFMQEVQSDPSIPKTVKLLYTGRGTIRMICANGEKATFGENGTFAEYDWGTCTNPGNYSEGEKSGILDRVKARTGFGNRGPAAPKPNSDAGGAKPSSLPAKVTEPPKTSTSAKATTVLHNKSTEELTAPPGQYTTKNEVQQWYRDHNGGVVPPDWKTRPKILDQKPDRQIADVLTVAQKKKAAEEAKAGNSQAKQPEVQPELLPIISPQSLEYYKSTFSKRGTVQKTISEGKAILDPKRVKDMESEYPSFLEATGLDGWNQVHGWEQEDIDDLIKNSPDLARRLITDLLYDDWKVQNAINENTQNEPEPQPEPAPRKSGFGNRKVG